MEALLFAPAAVAIALTPGPNNFCGLNNGIRAGVAAALIATVGRVAAFAAYSTRWRTRFHADGGQCSSVMADSVPR